MKTLSEIQAALSASKHDLAQKYQVQELGIFGSYCEKYADRTQ